MRQGGSLSFMQTSRKTKVLLTSLSPVNLISYDALRKDWLKPVQVESPLKHHLSVHTLLPLKRKCVWAVAIDKSLMRSDLESLRS